MLLETSSVLGDHRLEDYEKYDYERITPLCTHSDRVVVCQKSLFRFVALEKFLKVDMCTIPLLYSKSLPHACHIE